MRAKLEILAWLIWTLAILLVGAACSEPTASEPGTEPLVIRFEAIQDTLENRIGVRLLVNDTLWRADWCHCEQIVVTVRNIDGSGAGFAEVEPE